MDALAALNNLVSAEDRAILWTSLQRGRDADLATLGSMVAVLRAEFRNNDAQRFLLMTDDPLHCCVGLLALSGENREVVLCANRQRGWLAQVRSEFDAVLTDMSLEVDCPCFDFPLLDNRTALDWPSLTGDEAVSFLTSGSTGDAKLVPKTLRALTNEVDTLAGSFPESVSDTLFCASVSHLHIYGLLFRVLLPLVSANPVQREMIEYPEQLQQLAEQYKRLVFVSSPAFLSRLDARLPALSLLRIFSSGGPLSFDAAQESRRQLGQLPVEVYGSTETGGIAWRQQQHSTTPWQPFPAVELEAREGEVFLRSPNMPGQPPYALDDKLALQEDGSFMLQGRKDRIVKIEEKRISLTEIERFLEQQECIRQCVARVMTSARQTVACALVLSDTGHRQLAAEGEKSFVHGLRSSMQGQFEAVAIPRKWRIVDAVPLTIQGKTDADALEQLFRQKKESD